MPLTKKGERIRDAMQEQYGADKGEQVFYASQNKGTITGTHKEPHSKRVAETREPLGESDERKRKSTGTSKKQTDNGRPSCCGMMKEHGFRGY